MRTMILLISLLFSSVGFAFQPVPGTYWNPAEPGRGYAIEFQNGVIAITVYIYEANGDPIWYLAAGPMSSDNRRFAGVAQEYDNGQCITCSYSPPDLVGDEGTISITFSEIDQATLEWQGRSIPIERFDAGFGAAPRSMLGEWTFVFDIFVPFADRYQFTQIGPVLSTEFGGTGTFEDVGNNALGECYTHDTVAGQRVVVDFDSSDEIATTYRFVQHLDRVEGVYVSPTTFNEYPMQGWQTATTGEVGARARSRSAPRRDNTRIIDEPPDAQPIGKASPEVIDAIKRLAEAIRQ